MISPRTACLGLSMIASLMLFACEAPEAELGAADMAADAGDDAAADAGGDAEILLDAPPDAGEPDCRVDADCEATHGPWGDCQFFGEGERTCVHDLSGKTFRLAAFDVSGAVGDVLESTLRRLSAENKLNLLIHLESATDTGYTAWIIQGSPAGVDLSGLPIFEPTADLPTFMSVATPGEACAEGFSVCQDVKSLANENTGLEAGELALHLPLPPTTEGDVCAYRRFSMVATAVLSVEPLNAGNLQGEVAHIRLTGGIHGADARRLKVDASGTSLAQALERLGADPNFDFGGWRFEIEGRGQQVLLSPRSNPAVLQSIVPPGCAE